MEIRTFICLGEWVLFCLPPWIIWNSILTFRNCLFSKAVASFYIPTCNIRILISLHSHQHLFIVCLIIVILGGVKWHFIAILICIFPMTNVVDNPPINVLIGFSFFYGEMPIHILCSCFNCVVLFSDCLRVI